MSKKHASVLALAAALGALAGPHLTAAVAGPPSARAVATTVTIKDWKFDENTGFYRVPGTVTSRKAACARDRLIRVRHDDNTWTDHSDSEGRWAVRIHYSDVTSGYYKAIAVEKVIHRPGHDLTCARGTDRYLIGKG